MSAMGNLYLEMTSYIQMCLAVTNHNLEITRRMFLSHYPRQGEFFDRETNSFCGELAA